MNLDGRTAVVTGASSGVGRATAVAMADAGARVHLVARSADRLETVAETVRAAGGTAAVHPTDLTDTDDVVACGAAVRGDDGDRDPPTVLVNAAGAGDWRSILETDPGDVWEYLGVPLVGAFEMTRELLPAMLRHGEGRVVTVESPAGYAAVSGATGYVAARFGLRGLSEALHADLHSTPVGVTSVVPGAVDTEYHERNDNVADRMPPLADLRRLDADDVADAVVDAVRSEERRVVLPPEMKAAVYGARLAPDVLASASARLGWQPDREDWQAGSRTAGTEGRAEYDDGGGEADEDGDGD